MIVFKKITYRNFLSTGNAANAILLNKSHSTLVVGKNGEGKCLLGSTEVEINFLDDDTQKKYEEFLIKRS